MALPAGYTLDSTTPAPAASKSTLPAGYTLDGPAAPVAADAGPTPVQAAPPVPTALTGPPDNRSSTSRFLSNLWDQINLPGVIQHYGVDVPGQATKDMHDAIGRGDYVAAAGHAIRSAMPGYDIAHDLIKAQTDTVGKGVHTLLHPASGSLTMGDAASGLGHIATGLIPGIGPQIARAGEQASDGDYAGAAGTATGLVAGSLLPHVADIGLDAEKAIIAPRKVMNAKIPGLDITPLERYDSMKSMGIQPDLADATADQTFIPRATKNAVQHSLAGDNVFAKNVGTNVDALYEQAGGLLDNASPDKVSRNDFGQDAKNALNQHLEERRKQQNALYGQLDDASTSVPSAQPIRDSAQRILDQVGSFYDARPDAITPEQAKVLAQLKTDAVQPDTSWRNLQQLRSHYLDKTLMDDSKLPPKAKSWLHSQIGAIDQVMTTPSPDFTADDLANFRDANAIHAELKNTYDKPGHDFHYISRQTDPLKVADRLVNTSPTGFGDFSDAMSRIGRGDMTGQLQRQVMTDLLAPDGGDIDLKKFSSKYGANSTDKERLSAVLTPQRLSDLESLRDISGVVRHDPNASGSGKTAVKVAEAKNATSGIGDLFAGKPVQGIFKSGLTPFAYILAKAMNNPDFTEATMHPTPTPVFSAPDSVRPLVIPTLTGTTPQKKRRGLALPPIQ